jgi:hypothetical protein
MSLAIGVPVATYVYLIQRKNGSWLNGVSFCSLHVGDFVRHSLSF